MPKLVVGSMLTQYIVCRYPLLTMGPWKKTRQPTCSIYPMADDIQLHNLAPGGG